MMTMKKMFSLQVISSQSSYLLAIAMLAIIFQLASLQPAYSAPVENGSEQDDFGDDLGDLDDNLSPAGSRSGSQKQHLQDELSGLTSNDFGANLQGDQYPMSQAGSTGLGLAASTRGELTYGRGSSSSSNSNSNSNNNGNANNNYNNYNSNNDDSDSDADEADSDIESSNSDQPMQLAPASGRHHQSEASSMQNDNEASGFWPQNDSDNGASSSNNNNNDEDDSSLRGADQLGDGGEPHGLDSNIANAKIEMTANDMATAAGHHHHYGHGVHGWLEMGAKTGKKGAFKWHDKHPVGGKGRR